MTESISHATPTDPAAVAEIGQLTRGADPQWSAAYLDAANPSHLAALDRFSKLHERAYGAPGAEASGAPASPAGPARDDAGRFAPKEGESAPPAVQFPPEAYREIFVQAPEGAEIEAVIAINTAAREAASLLGYEPGETRGHVRVLEEAITRRAGKPMGELELADMEARLQRVAGDNYPSIVKGFEAAVKRAGPHGPWLRNAILASGPDVAATMIANMGRARV
jgi:hypothetical protein